LGDLNLEKLLRRDPDPAALAAGMRDLADERLQRLAPLLACIDFDRLAQSTPGLRYLDLGSNDGSILYAVKTRYPQVSVHGVEKFRENYERAISVYRSHAEFELKAGDWNDPGIYPRDHFDVVSSINAWPLVQPYDHGRAVAELHHYLGFVRPGGYLILRTWILPIGRGWIGYLLRYLVSRRGKVGDLLAFIGRARTLGYRIQAADLAPHEVVMMNGVHLVVRRSGAGQ